MPEHHSRHSDHDESHRRHRGREERRERRGGREHDDRDRDSRHRRQEEGPRVRPKEEPISPASSPPRPSTSAKDEQARHSPSQKRRHQEPAGRERDTQPSGPSFKLKDVKRETSEKPEVKDAAPLPRKERPKWELDDDKSGDEKKAAVEKEKPNFEPSGKLAEDTNTYKGIVIKYNEPQDARKTGEHWRLYPFRGDAALPIMHIHRLSAYLIGRETPPADVVVNHPSVSKQHAVLQYRVTSKELADGTMERAVRPYIIDLESTNGTCLNGERLQPRRYYELRASDVLNFGFSTRDFVLLKEVSADAKSKRKKKREAQSPSPAPS